MRSKSVIVAMIAAATLSACNSQDATVTSNAPSTSGPGAGAIAQNTQRETQRETTLSNATVKRSVFFSLISTDFRGTPTQTLGVSFLAEASGTTQAFTYHVDNGDIAYNSRVFVPTAGGVLLASQTGARETTLGLFDPRTRQSRTLGIIEGARIVKLVYPDQSTWAWTDRDGNAWVALGNLSQPTQLALNGLTATNIQINLRSRDVLVSGSTQGSSGTLVFSLDNLSTPKLRLGGLGAVESPDGSTIATILDDATSSKIAIFDVASNGNKLIDSHGAARGLRWKKTGPLALTYRFVSSMGVMTLHELDITTGADAALVPLHLTDALTVDDNVACPVWSGKNSFYFADLQNSKYAIYRATRSGQSWTVEPFALPSQEMTGFICPEILSTVVAPGGSS